MDDDYRILDKNKLDITNILLKEYKYDCEELFAIRKSFDKTINIPFLSWLMRKGAFPREMLLGNILKATSNLNIINEILNPKGEKIKLTRSNKHSLSLLGLFEVVGKSTGSVTCFRDKFGIANYFPGYERNKQLWDNLRNEYVTTPTLYKLLKKEIDIGQISDSESEKKRKKKEAIRDKLLKYHNFSNEELDLIRKEFEQDTEGKKIFAHWLSRGKRSNRQKLLGDILSHSRNAGLMEGFFERIEEKDEDRFRRLRATLNALKILRSTKGGIHTKIEFLDEYKLSYLFEGFEKNEAFWASMKGKNFIYKEFWDLIYKKNREQLGLNHFI